MDTTADTPTASMMQTWTGEKTCCCKSESKITSAKCDAKGYKWVKARRYPWHVPLSDIEKKRWGLKDRCCTYKNGSCPFFSHYKRADKIPFFQYKVKDVCL